VVADSDGGQHQPEAAAVATGEVFVSYSSQDASAANAIVKALETGGLKCWIAPRDVRAGAHYADAIVRAITSARAFVLVLSAHAMDSPHVGREIERASSKRRPIFAMRLDLTPLTPGFEYFLSESQWIEAESVGFEAACRKLIDAIREPQRLAPANRTSLDADASAKTAAIAHSAAVKKRIWLVVGVAIVSIAAIAIAALVFAGWYLSKTGTDKRIAAIPSTPTASTVANDRSIAVLPFETRSARANDAFFTNGIHDDILSQLSKIGALKVIALSSVEQFRNTKLTIAEIGKALGVARVLEGGVQRSGDRVHVTVQLVDVVSDAHLWAESYDRQLTVANVFSIQSEIAAAIAGALKATLTPAEQIRLKAVPVQNLEAWEAYQLAQQRTANRTPGGFADAERLYRKAIALDPNFALVYAGLAEALIGQIDYSGAPPDANLAKAEQAVNKALKLDPDLAEAWEGAAMIASYRDQNDRAEALFRRAISLNPNYALAYQHYSTMLTFSGRASEALGLAERAVQLDPLSQMVNASLGVCLEALGRFDAAESAYRKVIEIDPAMPRAYWQLSGFMSSVRNRFADAVLLQEKSIELAGDKDDMGLAAIYLDLDEAQAASMIQAASKQARDTNPNLLSTLYLYQGDREAAMRIARQHLEESPRSKYALELLRDDDLSKGEAARARTRYAKAYPEFFAKELPGVDPTNLDIAIDLVPVLQQTGDTARATELLDRIEKGIRTFPRMGSFGFGITDAQIYALRGQEREALSALRVAEKAGWRESWRYYRDFAPEFNSVRSQPEFKAIFADIKRDMARQRAELAVRRKQAARSQ
jgi:TolB-like protein